MTKPNPKELNQAEADRSIKRIKQLLKEDMLYSEMVSILNSEGYKTIKGKAWTSLNLRQTVFVIRHQERSWYGLSARRANLDLCPA